MKRLLKWLGLILGIFLVFLVIVFTNHQIQLRTDDENFVPMGEMVNVDGHNMHVYSEGNGNKTLIFMSGGGTSSPFLDFKALYSRLSDDFQTVVVEKVGYGFSDTADVDRSMDAILSDTRQALQLADVHPPYILMPHSMSGLEALYWAQNYPDEVEAITGLDMAVPEAYEDYPINYPMIRITKFAADIGFTRLLPGISESDAIKSGQLTDEEEEMYRSVFYRRTLTTPMVNEIRTVKDNAQLVDSGGIPNVPIYMYASNGDKTGFDSNQWQAIQQNFIESAPNGFLTQLDVPHYIHNYAYDMLAEEIIELFK